MKSTAKQALIILFLSSILVACQPSSSSTTPVLVGTSSGNVVDAQYYPATNQPRGVGAQITFSDNTYGNALGRQPYPEDIRSVNHGFTKATRVPVGETVYWHSKRTGHWGTFCPIRDGHALCGDYCREFVTTTVIDGHTERTYGTACRKPNGTWELM